MNTLRILSVAEGFYGGGSRACCYALRRLGHDVHNVDSQTFFPDVRGVASRAVVKLVRNHLISEYNERILGLARQLQPDLLLAFKAPYLLASTLRELRRRGCPLYNFYPDTSVFAHGPFLPEALAEYDCVFFTNTFTMLDAMKRIAIKTATVVPQGYDPEVHFPRQLSSRDVRDFGSDVSYVGNHSTHKEEVLDSLAKLFPEMNLRIWGNWWRQRCASGALKRYIVGVPVEGSIYAKTLQASRINLAIMYGIVYGASQGDETSNRTYEIPASGGFMLHERTPEVLQRYHEDTEIACFSSTEELVEKIRYYLAHPGQREALARAGHARCVPAYSFENRMSQVISWHEQHSLGSGPEADPGDRR